MAPEGLTLTRFVRKTSHLFRSAYSRSMLPTLAKSSSRSDASVQGYPGRDWAFRWIARPIPKPPAMIAFSYPGNAS